MKRGAPVLVRLIRAHLDRFGTRPDGRLFRGAQGSLLSESSYGRIWQFARQKALTHAQVDSRWPSGHTTCGTGA